jgi:Tol biopolymer transport system component
MRPPPLKIAVPLFVLASGALAVVVLSQSAETGESAETVGSAHQVWLVRSDGSALHKLKPSVQWQRGVSWSPNSRQLAFTSRRKRRGTLEIGSVASGAIRRIAVDRRLGSPSAPAWSPRGNELAFAAGREGKIDFTQSIATIGVDGTGLRRLASHPSGAGIDAGPVWSPDGRRIAYIRQRKWRPPKNKPAPPVHPVTGSLDLVIVSRTGRKRVVRIPGDDDHPRWSPDGRRIAFIHENELRTVRPDGRGQRRLGVGLKGLRSPAWSPDSRRITVTAIGSDRRPHLFVVDSAGDPRQVPVSGLVAQVPPAWSPDGSLITFTDYEGHLNVVAPDGSGQRTVATLASAEFYELAWSPDGRWIAFVAAKRHEGD